MRKGCGPDSHSPKAQEDLKMAQGTQAGALLAAVLTVVLLVSGVTTTIGIVPYLFLDYKKDTNNLSNATLVIVTGLAVLAFTYAQALNEDAENRRQLVLAGEIFLVAALLLVLATIFKFTFVKTNWTYRALRRRRLMYGCMHKWCRLSPASAF
jgi:succinate dehydrogenase hydrophobic anchor subunit